MNLMMAAEVLIMGVVMEPRFGFDGVDRVEVVENRDCFIDV